MTAKQTASKILIGYFQNSAKVYPEHSPQEHVKEAMEQCKMMVSSVISLIEKEGEYEFMEMNKGIDFWREVRDKFNINLL